MRGWLTGLLLLAPMAHAGDAERVFEQLRGSMVVVTVFDERNAIEGEGSGVAVATDKIITNCHVVQDSFAIRVTLGDQSFPAVLEREDVERDLCRLEVKGLNAKPAALRATQDLAPGEAVFAIGNPLGLGLSVSSGIVSAVKEYQGQRLVFSSTPIAPGSSGGGLFDVSGKLVAITSARMSRGQNFNLAVPSEGIPALAQRGKAPVRALESRPDPDWVAQAEEYRISGQWAMLADWSRKWGSTYPSSSIADGYLGLALNNLGQPDRAQQLLVNATRDPGNASARAYLAMVLHDLGEHKQAEKWLDQAMRLEPRTAFYWLVRAEWQQQDKNYAGLLESAREIIRREPWNSRGWGFQGAALHSMKRFDEAAKAYRTSLRLQPNDPGVTSGLAAVLALSGANADARKVLAGAAQSQAYDAGSWVTIGLEEEKNKKPVEAERAYRKALELDARSWGAWHRLGVVLAMTGRVQDAEKAFRKTLELKPDTAEVMADLADVLQLRGEKTERQQLLEKAYALSPSSPRVAYALAGLRREMNNYPGMIEPLQTVAKAEPKSAPVWAWLGDALVRSGKADEAYRALKTAQELDPRNAIMLSGFSTYHGVRGQYAEALSYAEQSLAIDGTDAVSWSNKGYSLLKLGRVPEAVSALETSMRLQPDLVPVWINLGEAYLRQKQLGKAINTLEHATSLAPGAVDARTYLAQAYLANKQLDKAKSQAESLTQLAPQHAAGWYLLTGIHLAQNNRKEALDSYDRLKQANPAAARELREKSRGRLPPGFEFPL